MGGPRNAAYIWAIVVLAVLAAASIVPTPFYLLAPGSAVELSDRIVVRDHRAPARRFYLTDVTLARATLLLLAGRLLPGTQIVRRERIVPSGVSARSYERVLVDAMADSQNVAAAVAERAAGYRVATRAPQFEISGVGADSHASGVLFPGERILAVDGRTVRDLDDVSRAIRGKHPGSRVSVRIERGGRPLDFAVKTMDDDGTTRLGVALRERFVPAPLPIPVSYTIEGISGSSGGLMFALEIYAALRGGTDGEPVAGTGTIASDGHVGSIEGTFQKLVAAKRAGARIFLVPKANYREIATERDIRVIPVETFSQALRAIGLRAATRVGG